MIGLFTAIRLYRRWLEKTPPDRIISFKNFSILSFLFGRLESFKKLIHRHLNLFKTANFAVFGIASENDSYENFEQIFNFARTISQNGLDVNLFVGFWYCSDINNSFCRTFIEDDRFLDIFGVYATQYLGRKEFIFLLYGEQEIEKFVNTIADIAIKNGIDLFLVGDKEKNILFYKTLPSGEVVLDKKVNASQIFDLALSKLVEIDKWEIKILQTVLELLEAVILVYFFFKKHVYELSSVNFVSGFYAIRPDLIALFLPSFDLKKQSGITVTEELNQIGVIV